MKKKLIKVALRLVEIEKNLMNGGRMVDFQKEFDTITKQLSVKDMLEIDAYIVEHNLLKEEEKILTK